MKNALKLFTFGLLLMISLISFSQTSQKSCKTSTTSINGHYQGKNLYFQTTLHAIQQITINDKVYPVKITTEAFELDLSNFKNGDAFEIKISYCEDVKTPYKILNPEALK